MTRKEQLEYLIEKYRAGEYKTQVFCNEFTRVLYHEEDESIKKKEYEILDFYAQMFSRFSPYEEDIETGALFGEEKIICEFKNLIKELSEDEKNDGNKRANCSSRN